MTSVRNVLSANVMRLTSLLLVIILIIITDVQGRPAKRVARQASDPRDSIIITGDVSNQLCPVVDCAESDVLLPCPRDSRVQTTFVVNGNTCPGCMGCQTTTVAMAAATKPASPKGPNDV